MRAVQFRPQGDPAVLEVEVADPFPRHGQVLVRVKAAGINPAEAKIRTARGAAAGRRRFPPVRIATWPA